MSISRRGKSKASTGIAVGEVGEVHPVLDGAGVVPELGHAVGLEELAVAHVAIFLDGGDGVGAVAFDEVVAEAVEADLFDQPARQLEQLGIDIGVAVREIGHVAEGHLIPRFVHVGMEAFPVARELAALGIEAGPARLAGDGIDLLRSPRRSCD